MNLKEFIENNQKNIKKIPDELVEYQKFFDFHKILWPVFEDYKSINHKAVGLEYLLGKIVDLSNHYSYCDRNKDIVEIDLQNIFILSHCDVIKNNLKITEVLENGEKRDININYEIIEYDRNYNIEKNILKDEYINLKKIKENDSVIVLRIKNMAKIEVIQINIKCLLFL